MCTEHAIISKKTFPEGLYMNFEMLFRVNYICGTNELNYFVRRTVLTLRVST